MLMPKSKDRSEYGQRLYDARIEAKLTQAALAKMAGVPQSSLAEAELKGNSSRANAALAEALNLHAKFLESGTGPKYLKPPAEPADTARHEVRDEPRNSAFETAGRIRISGYIPVVGTAKMGDDGFYEEISTVTGAGDGHIELETADKSAYCLRARGMSNHPAIRDGWYILVLPNSAPVPGEFCLIKLKDGRKMIKEFLYQGKETINVMSVNGEERFTVEVDNIQDIQAVGGILQPRMYKPD